ncbi:MAG: hypothetical protein V1859_02120 [archaeon]
MAQNNPTVNDLLPEPPKFNLDDLPEPPKITQAPQKKGIFGKFSLKKEENVKVSPQLIGPEKKSFDLEMPLPPQLDEAPRIVDVKQDLPSLNLNTMQEDNPLPPGVNDFPRSESLLSSNIEQSLPKLDDLPSPPLPNKEQKQKAGIFSKLFSGGKKTPKTDIIMPEIKAEPLPTPLAMPELDLSSVNFDMPKQPDLPQTTASLPEVQTQTNVQSPMFEVPPSLDASPDKLSAAAVATSSLSSPPEQKQEEIKQDAILQTAQQSTPLTDINGVGDKTASLIKKKLKVNSAEELIKHPHEHITKKTKLPTAKVKAILKHAKILAKKKAKFSKNDSKTIETIKKEGKNISDLIQELDVEKKELAKLKQEGIKGIPEIKGHDDILTLIEKLEKKKLELIDYETKLKAKESNLDSVNNTYKRDADYLENLRRRLDHDIRERTQYLIQLEKDFFNKGQDIAKRQSKVELKEQELIEKEKSIKEANGDFKKKQHELEDKEITLSARETQLKKLMREIDKQEELLKKKEADLAQADKKYLKRIEVLEKHEKETAKLLENRKKELDLKAKELSKKDTNVSKRERTIDIEDRALDYAETEVETQRQKLEDDQFKQYLHEKLGLMKETGIGVKDIEQTHEIKVPDLQEKPQNIYDLVAKCKHLIKMERTKEAKLFYNQIRDTFYKVNFMSSQEKENLHNQVRALYDEINLAELNKPKDN